MEITLPKSTPTTIEQYVKVKQQYAHVAQHQIAYCTEKGIHAKLYTRNTWKKHIRVNGAPTMRSTFDVGVVGKEEEAS